MQQRVFDNKKIEVLWNREILDIVGDKENGVKELRLHNKLSGKDETLPCDAVFIAIGHVPNSQLFKGQLEMDENGYLTPKPNSTSTNIEGVFACGDVQDHKWRQAITAAGSGCMAAIEAERWLEAAGK